jgi:tRNA threonylcarbamoyladenosine modification (KEOPS) complex  Pcc1 subunit
MRSLARFKLSYESEKKAGEMFRVLNLEVKSDSRVQTQLAQKQNTVSLHIRSKDRNALRSTVNTYGRWIRLFEEIGGIE